MGQLGTEKELWAADEIRSLKLESQNVPGDCLLGSAFLSYAAPFNEEFRNQMLHQNWLQDILSRGVPVRQPFHVEHLLATPTQINWYNLNLKCYVQ